MTIAFWIALTATLLWIGLVPIASVGMDTWGARLIPLIYLFGAVAMCAGVVFIALFALHSLGIDIHLSRTDAAALRNGRTS